MTAPAASPTSAMPRGGWRGKGRSPGRPARPSRADEDVGGPALRSRRDGKRSSAPIRAVPQAPCASRTITARASSRVSAATSGGFCVAKPPGKGRQPARIGRQTTGMGGRMAPRSADRTAVAVEIGGCEGRADRQKQMTVARVFGPPRADHGWSGHLGGTLVAKASRTGRLHPLPRGFGLGCQGGSTVPDCRCGPRSGMRTRPRRRDGRRHPDRGAGSTDANGPGGQPVTRLPPPQQAGGPMMNAEMHHDRLNMRIPIGFIKPPRAGRRREGHLPPSLRGLRHPAG